MCFCSMLRVVVMIMSSVSTIEQSLDSGQLSMAVWNSAFVDTRAPHSSPGESTESMVSSVMGVVPSIVHPVHIEYAEMNVSPGLQSSQLCAPSMGGASHPGRPAP